MMINQFSFSDVRLKNLETPPKGTRRVYRDERSPGLILRHTDTGVKTFYTYARMKDRKTPVKVSIGRYPDISIQTARNRNDENRNAMGRGLDPNSVRRAKRAEVTLGEHFSYCLESIFKVHNKSWREYEAIYNRYLSKWANRPLSELTAYEIQAHHARLGKENGTYSANRMLQLLSSLYNKAVARGFEKPNPCKGIKKFREKSRDRFLEAHELKAFFEAVSEESNKDMRDFVLMLLLTGARRSNVISMKWNNVNFSSETWYIPETKNGTSQKVALVTEAIKILKERHGNDPIFVFPGPGSKGHMIEPRKAWVRILERAEIKDLRIHDLRRTLGSWQAATGASLSVIGKSLNHKSVQATAIYARLNLDPVRESLRTATQAMFDAAKEKVIPIDHAKQRKSA